VYISFKELVLERGYSSRATEFVGKLILIFNWFEVGHPDFMFDG
jgi:hypothetical protein